MIAFLLSAALASALQPGGAAMGAAASGPSAAAPSEAAGPAPPQLSDPDLQRWIDDQPEVQAYEQLKAVHGVRPPPVDAFRRQPTLPSPIACRSSRSALQAAVKLFQVSDQGKIMLSEPDLVAHNDGRVDAMLNDPQKQALQDRAKQYEQDAGAFEPACLG